MLQGAIDFHNRVRQDLLAIEKAVGIHRWVLRLGCTVLGIILTDCRYLCNFACTSGPSSKQFFSKLASELIENDFDEAGIERTFAHYYNSDYMSMDNAKNAPQLNHTETTIHGHQDISTKRRRMKCAARCGKKTTWECFECIGSSVRSYFCHYCTERKGFEDHTRSIHEHV